MASCSGDSCKSCRVFDQLIAEHRPLNGVPIIVRGQCMFRKKIRDELVAAIEKNRAKAKADLDRKIAELKKSTNMKNLSILLDEAVDVTLITREEANLILARLIAEDNDDSWNTLGVEGWTPPEEANGSPKEANGSPKGAKGPSEDEDDRWPEDEGDGEGPVPTLVPRPVPVGSPVSENAGTRTNNLSLVTTPGTTGTSGNIPSSNNRSLVTSGTATGTSGNLGIVKGADPRIAIRLAEIEKNPYELLKAADDSLKQLKFKYEEYFIKLAINNYYGVRSITGQPKNGNITNYDRTYKVLSTTGYEFMEGRNIMPNYYLEKFKQYYVTKYTILYKQYIQEKMFIDYNEFSELYNGLVFAFLSKLKRDFPDTKRVTDEQKFKFRQSIQLESLTIDHMKGGSRKVTRKVKMNKRRRASRRS